MRVQPILAVWQSLVVLGVCAGCRKADDWRVVTIEAMAADAGRVYVAFEEEIRREHQSVGGLIFRLDPQLVRMRVDHRCIAVNVAEQPGRVLWNRPLWQDFGGQIRASEAGMLVVFDYPEKGVGPYRGARFSETGELEVGPHLGDDPQSDYYLFESAELYRVQSSHCFRREDPFGMEEPIPVTPAVLDVMLDPRVIRTVQCLIPRTLCVRVPPLGRTTSVEIHPVGRTGAVPESVPIPGHSDPVELVGLPEWPVVVCKDYGNRSRPHRLRFLDGRDHREFVLSTSRPGTRSTAGIRVVGARCAAYRAGEKLYVAVFEGVPIERVSRARPPAIAFDFHVLVLPDGQVTRYRTSSQ